MASVTYSHVYKQYGPGIIALEDLSLEIRDQEFMVLVGPSGCGKSTALRLLAGLEIVTDGELRIGDQIINNVIPRDRDIAMVFQSYALYPHMSVSANMAYPLRVRRVPASEINRRVTEAAQILGLEDCLHRRPRELSGGQRQRVALGRAIVRDPQVFLLDEPLSNLDAKLRAQTRLELKKLHRRLGTTFIYVTHDQVEAMTMGDRIAVMRGGLLQQVATPGEIYDHPANAYVAGFIGSPTMNIIPARVQDRKAKARGFELPLGRAVPSTEVLLGIRPEALRQNGKGDATLELTVDVVERLGSDQYVYGRVGEDAITARLDPAFEVRGGDVVRLGLNSRAVHIFDAGTEERVF